MLHLPLHITPVVSSSARKLGDVVRYSLSFRRLLLVPSSDWNWSLKSLLLDGTVSEPRDVDRGMRKIRGHTPFKVALI